MDKATSLETHVQPGSKMRAQGLALTALTHMNWGCRVDGCSSDTLRIHRVRSPYFLKYEGLLRRSPVSLEREHISEAVTCVRTGAHQSG